jgi:hypothetical protein
MVCINREHSFWAFAENSCEDREDAVLFFLRADGLRAGARGFSSDVDEVGAFIEHGERVLDGTFGIEESAAVGKGVGGDVEDAHDEGAFAERKPMGAELPGGTKAADERHTGTMLHSSDNAVS